MSLRDLRDLAADRHSHEPLLDGVLDLRNAVSACDAVYVALAELLGAASSPPIIGWHGHPGSAAP